MDPLDIELLTGDYTSSDVEIPENEEETKCVIPKDNVDNEASDADIQRLVSDLKQASNKKGTKMISQAEHAALQKTTMAPMRTENPKKRRIAPSATEQIQRKRLHNAVQPTTKEKLARNLPAPTTSNRTSLGIKIRLDRMRADLVCMKPGPDGGDDEEVLEALQALIEAAEGTAERFRH